LVIRGGGRNLATSKEGDAKTASTRTLRGLDGLNFFLAGILTQTPAGALVDRLRSKRALIAMGIVALAVGALLIALAAFFSS
jgi:MFS family permease